jgi:hypothetical protein
MAKDPTIKEELNLASVFAEAASQLSEQAYEKGKREENAACAALAEKGHFRSPKEIAQAIRNRMGGASEAPQTPPVQGYNTGVNLTGPGGV